MARLEPEAALLPEADCAEGARHPRFAPEVLGQDGAIATWLAAQESGRNHHAWLLVGPKGIGKATLAWKLAAQVLSDASGGMFGGPSAADIARGLGESDPVTHRLQALSEPRFKLIRRAYDEKGERFRANILVDDIRELRDFFHLSAADGGSRAVLVDAADEMNVAASNALLKSLEEPPKGAVFFLVAESVSAILPTIRSRCRLLTCAPLAGEVIATVLADQGIAVESGIDALAGGSAGRAIRLARHDGVVIWKSLLDLFRSGSLDRSAAHVLADSLAGKTKAERQEVVFDLIALFLARLALQGARGAGESPVVPEESAVLARLSPAPRSGQAFALLASEALAKIRHGRAVNLDPGLLLLDTLQAIEGVARGR